MRTLKNIGKKNGICDNFHGNSMKKEILIYENEKETLKFLRSFFRERKDYTAHFITSNSIETLRAELDRKKPDALIVGNTDVFDYIKPSEVESSIIA